MQPGDSIARDPLWLPHTFDQAGDRIDFVRLTLQERRRLAFLAQEYVGRDFPHQVLPYADVKAVAPAEDPSPLHFIFHTSFCCSSLLARALEAGGAAEALREPDILMNLANRFLREPGAANMERLDVMLRLLARPLQASRMIIKPSNFANNLIGPILKLRPQARALLIHSDLESFIRSLTQKGMWGRIWARKLFAQHSAWSQVRLGLSPAEMFELTDLQVMGLAWLQQAAHFRQLAQHHGSPRVTLIHSAVFVAQREAAIRLLSNRLALGYDAQTAQQIAAGDVFARNSKSSDRAFDPASRDAKNRQAFEAHREEIGMVTQWLETVAGQAGSRLSLDDLDAELTA